MGTKHIVSIGVLAVAAMLSGCGTVAKFDYPPAGTRLTRVDAETAAVGGLVVERFQDFRGEVNDIAPFYLYLIPLFPFGYYEYERPESGRWFLSVEGFEFNPSVDLTRAAAISMRHSGLFRQVVKAGHEDAMSAEYILRGGILSTYYKGRVFSYGLSFEGPWLWILGLPAGTSLNRLSMFLQLVERGSGAVVWTYAFDLQDYLTQGLYYRYGRDTSIYGVLAAEGMNRAVKSMEEYFLRKK